MHSRIDYIDTAKGVLIILIILGHIFFKAKPMYFAYTFHISSFLIITGILFAHVGKVSRPYWHSVKSAFYTLVIPFLFFETIGGIIRMIAGADATPLQMITNPLCGRYYVAANWYLQSSFLAELLFLIVEKIIPWKPVKAACYFVMYVFGVLLPRVPFHFLLLDRVLISTVLIAIGFYLHDVYTTADPWVTLIACLLTGLCTWCNGYVSLYSITVGNPVMYLTGAVAGAYFCIALCRMLPEKPLAIVGKSSLILMGTHQLFLNYFHLDKYLLAILIFAAEIPIVWLLRRYLPFCIGIRGSQKSISR